MKAARSKAKSGKKPTATDAKKGKHPHIGVMIAVGPVSHGMPGADEAEESAHVDGGKAKRRLDRPSRKAYASGGHVRGPSPSLRQASLGVDANHPAFHAPQPDDAPDVVTAKSMLHSPAASRLSDDDVKAIGDYIIEHANADKAVMRKQGDDAGAGSGEDRIEKATAYGEGGFGCGPYGGSKDKAKR